jgi:hypothetical protein
MNEIQFLALRCDHLRNSGFIYDMMDFYLPGMNVGVSWIYSIATTALCLAVLTIRFSVMLCCRSRALCLRSHHACPTRNILYASVLKFSCTNLSN